MINRCARRIVIVGAVLLGGSPGSVAADVSNIFNQAGPPANVIAAPDQKMAYRPPCRNRLDPVQCDLEAQWVAANAARSSALWALLQVAIGALGVVGLGFTLWYTRDTARAAIAAGEDTKNALHSAAVSAAAAEKQVGVAERALAVSARSAVEQVEQANRALALQREMNEKQIRAYVVVKNILPHAVRRNPAGSYKIEVQLENVGDTPAVEVQAALEAYWRNTDSGCVDLTLLATTSEPLVSPDAYKFVIGKGQSFSLYSEGLLPVDFVGIWEGGNGAVILRGVINYNDVFGNPCQTTFSYNLTSLEHGFQVSLTENFIR